MTTNIFSQYCCYYFDLHLLSILKSQLDKVTRPIERTTEARLGELMLQTQSMITENSTSKKN